MAFKEVTDLGTDNVIALGGFNKKTKKDNATSIEGYFLGSREVPSKLAKSGFAKIHVFQTSKGNVGVWGKTDLDIKLAGVTVGTMVLAKFDKMQATKTGEMYKYKVLVDEDNTIEVSGAADQHPTTGDDEVDSYAQDDEADVDTESEEDEDAAQAAALAQAERQAKVAALLRKNKTAKA